MFICLKGRFAGKQVTGPPLGLAATLPSDWQKQVLSFQHDGPDTPVLRFLQDCVQQHGDEAVEVRAVQILAEWVTRLDRPDPIAPFPLLRTLLADIGQHAGPWAVESVISECRCSIDSHPIDLSQRLDGGWAEWCVLNYLLDRGWSAIKRPRQRGDFDWHVQKGATLGVEVKQKAATGSTRHALEWSLRGLSLLPAGSWIHKYRWCCRVPESARSKEVSCFADALRPHLEAIAAAIDDELGKGKTWEDPRSIPGTGLLIRAKSWGSPAVVLSHPSAPDVRVVVKPNKDPRVLWITGDTMGWVPPELGESEAAEIARVFCRLGAAKQNAARQVQGLFVFVWWVPAHWEHPYSRAWMRATCDQLAEQLGLQYAAVWPQGYFETARESWVLSSKAAGAFSDLDD